MECENVHGVQLFSPDKKSLPFTFKGENKVECEEFVSKIRQHAAEEGKTDNSSWNASQASACFAGKALHWYTSLPPEVQNDWSALESAILSEYPRRLALPAEPARILVEDWDSVVFPSRTLLPIGSRAQWLNAARERRKLYQAMDDRSTVCWLLVEDQTRIPDEAIRTGRDLGGNPLYSVRTYFETEGLTVGKYGPHLNCAAFPLGGIELGCYAPFEILVGDGTKVRWISIPSESEKGESAPRTPFFGVEGGFKLTGRESRASFISKIRMEGTWHPGKVHSGDTWPYASFGGNEWMSRSIQLLAWTD